MGGATLVGILRISDIATLPPLVVYSIHGSMSSSVLIVSLVAIVAQSVARPYV
jgi:hypothetical protein